MPPPSKRQRVESTETGSTISRARLQDLVAQVDPNKKLDPEVEALLQQIADDFVESVTTAAVALAKHRGSDQLEAKDVALELERSWGIHVPGFATMPETIKPTRKLLVPEKHRQRLLLIRRKAREKK